MTAGAVHLVIAHPAEARPLIAALDLEPAGPAEPYRLLAGEGVRLILTGTGRTAAAAAVGYLHGRFQGSPVDPGACPAWLNAGLGGHRELPRGEVRIAEKITEDATHRSWYPPLVFDTPVPGAEIRTVDRPETEFLDDAIHDMEASAFFLAASRCATAECVQVLKIISDNREHSYREITGKLAEDLVTGALPAIQTLIRELTDLSAQMRELRADPPELEEILGRWRFTRTQQAQLRDLLRRFAALAPGSSPLRRIGEPCDAREVLRALRAETSRPTPLRGAT